MQSASDLKVLWFCNSLSYKEDSNSFKFILPPWVEAAANELSLRQNIKLAIAAQTEKANLRTYTIGNIKYYTLSTGLNTLFKKWIYKISHRIDIPNSKAKYKFVFEDFQPDVVCVFGTEFAFAEIIPYSQVPVVIHIQSIVSAYLPKWFAGRMNFFKMLYYSNLFSLVKGSGILHAYYRFKKQAKRELIFYKKARFFIGRTDWDKKLCNVMAKNATYFHCDEMLRHAFYESSFAYSKKEELQLLTVINPNIYKGLELIMDTAVQLKKTGINFTWKIVGISPNDEVVRMATAVSSSDFDQGLLEFKGQQPAETMVEIMRNSHIYVHASHIENSSNGICEAMLFGLPVVALNTGGTSSLIRSGVDGVLLEDAHSTNLCNAIIDLYNDEKKCREIGGQARQTALKRHDKISITDNLVKIFTSVASLKN